MKVMGKTITGAASGETDLLRRRRIHNLRQKDRRRFCAIGAHSSIPLPKIGHDPIFFYFSK
jgi:hypothetical protein